MATARRATVEATMHRTVRTFILRDRIYFCISQSHKPRRAAKESTHKEVLLPATKLGMPRWYSFADQLATRTEGGGMAR